MIVIQSYKMAVKVRKGSLKLFEMRSKWNNRKIVLVKFILIKCCYKTHLIKVFERPPLELLEKMFVFAEDHFSD